MSEQQGNASAAPAGSNHTTISVAMVATAASGLAIAITRRYGVDLAGQEANIGTLALAACYLIQRRLELRGALPPIEGSKP